MDACFSLLPAFCMQLIYTEYKVLTKDVDSPVSHVDVKDLGVLSCASDSDCLERVCMVTCIPEETRLRQFPLRKSWKTRLRWLCNILAWM